MTISESCLNYVYNKVIIIVIFIMMMIINERTFWIVKLIRG